jgi:hypothetical protein
MQTAITFMAVVGGLIFSVAVALLAGGANFRAGVPSVLCSAICPTGGAG